MSTLEIVSLIGIAIGAAGIGLLFYAMKAERFQRAEAYDSLDYGIPGIVLMIVAALLLLVCLVWKLFS